MSRPVGDQGCQHIHKAAEADWDCLPPAILIGIVPSIAMVVMLRCGAPLLPRVSLAPGELAVWRLSSRTVSPLGTPA